MIDVHCHLDHFKNWEELIGPEIEVAITAGLGKKSITDCLKMDSRKVKVTAGCDPRLYEDLFEFIRSVEKKIVGIGEVGLDWYPKKEKEQKEWFELYINLATELNLPLIVHSRSAGKYALEILFEKEAETVVMHAFDGSAKYVSEAVDRGYMFSIPPSIARSRQKELLVKALPIENLLLESDAPSLGPIRGEVNLPCNISVSAEKIAEIKKIELEEVKRITSKNARGIFRL